MQIFRDIVIPGTCRITREKAHPGDNVFTFKNIVTGRAVVGGGGCVLSIASPVTNTMRESLAARGCGDEGVY